MSCCAKRKFDCDDAILDRLNGVDNIEIADRGRCRKGRRQVDNIGFLSDPCGSCWQTSDVCRNRQRSICDFCWLWSRCPYRESDRFRD